MDVDKSIKIYVAGHRGMVGSAIVRALNAKGFNNVIGCPVRVLIRGFSSPPSLFALPNLTIDLTAVSDFHHKNRHHLIFDFAYYADITYPISPI